MWFTERTPALAICWKTRLNLCLRLTWTKACHRFTERTPALAICWKTRLNWVERARLDLKKERLGWKTRPRKDGWGSHAWACSSGCSGKHRKQGRIFREGFLQVVQGNPENNVVQGSTENKVAQGSTENNLNNLHRKQRDQGSRCFPEQPQEQPEAPNWPRCMRP